MIKMNYKNRKNLFLTIIVMLATLCISSANIIKEKHTMDNKDEQKPEEILPNIYDEQDPESIQKPMAGIIISPKEGEKIEPYEKLQPIGGDVLPTTGDNEPNSSENVDDEEILSINVDITDVKINIPETKQTPLAGKVMPIPLKKEDEKIAPLAGEVIPCEEPPQIDNEPQSDGYVPPEHPLPGTVCGDIPPSFMNNPKKKSGFFKSFLDKFRKDNY